MATSKPTMTPFITHPSRLFTCIYIRPPSVSVSSHHQLRRCNSHYLPPARFRHVNLRLRRRRSPSPPSSSPPFLRQRTAGSGVVMGSIPAEDGSLTSTRLSYPPARRDDSVVDVYHGVPVSDPYRWLEDPDAKDTKQFVEEQVKVTNELLGTCKEREMLRQRITEMFNYPKYSAPFKRGGKYFYFHNSGLQAQSVMYVQNGLENVSTMLLDPNSLSDDGTVALSSLSLSKDGHYLAYGLSKSGSDWVTVNVMRVDDKVKEMDTLSWVKFSSFNWTHDGKGFFYSRFPAPNDVGNVDAGTETDINENQEIYYHVLGTDQSQDILCWKDRENPKYNFGTEITNDGKYVLLYILKGCDPVNKLYYCDLSLLPHGIVGLKTDESMLPFVKLVDDFEGSYNYISNIGTEFTFLSNKDAPKYKIVRVDLESTETWKDVIEESKKDVLESAVSVNGNRLLVSYLSDVKHVVQIRDMKTGNLLHQLPLDIGSVSQISARHDDDEVFISFSSFLTPGIIYRFNLTNDTPEMTTFREISIPGFERTDFIVKQVFVPSKDGTKIPMFIISKNNIHMDGSHSSLLYGYGGFNFSLTPAFDVKKVILMKHLGIVVCTANIRGGGEYGEEWHKAGSLSQKQNCFDDFISTAEFLVSSGYTSAKNLCIEGGSNGGLLVAACINQRPDLFGCALAHVGVMDMLRFHKFTIGYAWTSDYGCSDKADEFNWLIRYSPLHNVKRPWEDETNLNVQYPPTMLLTADHDDRVVPLHSLKLLATMQHILCTSIDNTPQTNPIIGRIDTKAGHGAGRSTQKQINEAADRYGFMAKMLGASWIDDPLSYSSHL